MKLGTVGVNLGNVEAYRAALKGLSVEQSVFALASKGATEEQIRQILVTNQATAEDVEAAMAKAGLITATQALNAEEMIALATQKGIATERAKEIASALGLIATEEGQIISKKQLTVATLRQAGATDTEIAAMLGLNAVETTNIGITNVLTASFTKLWAVITAHPIGAILTAIGVVAVSAVAAYNKWGDTLENTKEKLSDLKSECQEIVSDLQAVNSELETTQQRLEELEGKDTLTFTEKEEYDNLVKINNELQRKIDLLELEEKNKRKEQNKTFVSAMEKDTENPFEHEVNPDGKKPAGQYSISDEYLTSETGYIEAQFEIRDQLLEDLANAETEKEKERIQKRIDEIEKYLNDKNDEWKNVSDGINYIENPTTEDDKAVNEWLDYISDFQDRMAIAMGGDNAKTNTFNRLVDNWKFDDTVQGLQDLGAQGKVTAEMLNDPKYDEFINKLVELGVIDSADNLNDIAKAFNGLYSDSYQNLIDLFGQDAVDKLTPEDLEIAYTISSEEADKALEQEKNKIKSELESLSKEGNVDLTIRPVIDSSAMQAAGWDVEDGSIATTFTQGEFIWQGDEENGQYVYVHYTPILPDGTVLTPDELTDYLYGTLEGSQSVLDADNKDIVLKVDTDLNIPEGDIKKFINGEGSTEAIDGLIQKTGEWDDKVHSVQEQYYDTGESVNYASNALDGLIEKHKQLENPDKITDLFSQAFNSTDFAEQKEALLELAKAGELTPKTLEITEEYNSLLTKTGLSAKELVEQIQNYADSNNDLARSQARLKYHELVQQLNDLDGATNTQTDSLIDQIHALQDTIAEYSRLEQQILGTTTAFTEFEDAKNVDSNTDYTSKITEMYAALKEGFSSGKVGTEAFKSAFDALIPEKIKNITDQTERLTKGLEYLNSSTNGEGIAKYFTFDGDSATVELKNVKNFINDLINQGVFTGDDWQNFDIAPDMNIDKIVEKTGLTKELIFTMFDEIDNYNVENSSLLDIIDDSLEGKIYRVDTKLAELNEQLIEAARNGDKDLMKTLREQIDELNDSLEGNNGLYQENIDNILAYKDACDSYSKVHEDYYKNIGSLQDNLAKAQENLATAESTGDATKIAEAKAEVQEYTDAIDEATNELNEALIAKSEFEKPTEMTVQLALDSIDSQIATLKQKLANTNDDNAKIPIQAQISGLESEKAKIKASVEADTEEAESNLESLKQQASELQDAINKIPKNVGISTSTAVKNVNNLLTTLDELSRKMNSLSSLKVNISTTKKSTSDSDTAESGAGAYGTVNITGRAHTNGNIGTSKAQKNVMVSEVAPEMVVDPNKGSYTIYQNPTMLSELPKNAIVFNGKQTEEILKNGMTTSFGKAYANGNVSGKAYGTGNDVTIFSGKTSSSTKSSGKSSSSSKSSSKDTKDTKTLIDWIARKLEVLQKKIDLTKAKFENLFDLKSKKSNLDTQIKQTTNLMKANEKAAKKYKKYADNYAKSSGLSASLIKKIQNGNYNIKNYSEKTAEKINKYKEYWDNYKEAQEQVEELKTSIRELQEEQYQLYVDDAEAKIDNANAQKDIAKGYKEQNKYLDEQKSYLKQSYDYQIKIAELTKDTTKVAELQAEYQKELWDLEKEKFDNIESYYENQIGLLELSEKKIQEQINLLEAKGMTVNAKYYKAEIAYQKGIREEYELSKKTLQDQLTTMESVGLKGTEQWYESVTALNEVDSAIAECNVTIAEMNNSITEVANTIQNRLLQSISNVSEEMDWIANIMSSNDLINEDTAGFTKEGLATLGSYVSGLNTSKYSTSITKELVEKMQEALDNNELSFSYNGQEWIYNSKEQLEEAIIETNTTWREQISESVEYSNKIIDMMIQKYESELPVLKKEIDLKKEALQLEKDMHDYKNTLSEKVESVSTLQRQLAAYSNDTSEEGMAKKQKILKQLDEAQKDLKETEYDKYISDQESMLDKLYNEYEELIGKKTSDRDALLRQGIEAVRLSATEIQGTIEDYIEDYNYTDVLDNIKNGLTNMTGTDSALESIKTSVLSSIETAKTVPTAIGGLQLSVENGLSTITSLLQQILKSSGTTIPTSLDNTVEIGGETYHTGLIPSSQIQAPDLTSPVGNRIVEEVPLQLVELKGYSQGGVVSADDIEKQVKANGDKVLISANPGEGLLTPIQTELFSDFVNNGLQDLVSATDMLKPLIDLPKMPNIQPVRNSTFGDTTINIEMHEVNDVATFSRQLEQAMKTPKVQKQLRSVTTDRITGGSRLGIHTIK